MSLKKYFLKYYNKIQHHLTNVRYIKMSNYHAVADWSILGIYLMSDLGRVG